LVIKTDLLGPEKKVVTATMTQQFNRATLQSLRAIKIAEDYEKVISYFIDQIKVAVVEKAKNTDETVYTYDYMNQSAQRMFIPGSHTNDIIIDNLEEVLLRLRQVFDGCVVSYTECQRARDGRYYDPSTIPESLLMGHRGNFETRKRFTIDWS
jgi:hypothetical protein